MVSSSIIILYRKLTNCLSNDWKCNFRGSSLDFKISWGTCLWTTYCTVVVGQCWVVSFALDDPTWLSGTTNESGQQVYHNWVEFLYITQHEAFALICFFNNRHILQGSWFLRSTRKQKMKIGEGLMVIERYSTST